MTNNNNIKIITNSIGKFDGTKPQFFDSEICFKPTDTLKCLLELAGICAAELKKGTDPNEIEYIDSEPTWIVGTDGDEHEYKIQLCCRVKVGIRLNSYALILFLYVQKFIFGNYEPGDEIKFGEDWKCGKIICPPPYELLTKLDEPKNRIK